VAIAIPSDIVSDVMSAADPVAYQEALGRLSRGEALTGDAAAVRFAAQSADAARRLGTDSNASAAGTVAPGTFRPSDAGGASAVYRKFEGFVLQVLVETMLPSGSTAFGKGTAGTVWRSMMAEQLGNQLAASGGIGIARLLAASHPAEGGAGTPTAASGRGEQKTDEQRHGS
jgi:Rod binding domain-containing protein